MHSSDMKILDALTNPLVSWHVDAAVSERSAEKGTDCYVVLLFWSFFLP